MGELESVGFHRGHLENAAEFAESLPSKPATADTVESAGGRLRRVAGAYAYAYAYAADRPTSPIAIRPPDPTRDWTRPRRVADGTGRFT